MAIEPHSIKKILVLRYRSIGDIILSFPTLEALKTTYPNARIDMVVDDVFEDLCYGHPYIDFLLLNSREEGRKATTGREKRELLWKDLKFIHKIRKQKYDMVVDLHSGPRSSLLTFLSGARYRVGHRMRLRSRIFYNISPPVGGNSLHSVEVMLRTIAPLSPALPEKRSLFLGYSPDDRAFAERFLERYDITQKDTLVMIHPGARVDFKRLPAPKLAEVVKWLVSELGVKVIYAGSDRDLSEISKIVSLSGKSGLVATNLKLGHLAALIDRCDLFIGNDSGPMHMAAALKVPLVVFFGPSDPAVWSPWAGRGKIVRCKKMDCMPCDQKGCKYLGDNCMDRIDIRHIKQAVLSTLQPESTTASVY